MDALDGISDNFCRPVCLSDALFTETMIPTGTKFTEKVRHAFSE